MNCHLIEIFIKFRKSSIPYIISKSFINVFLKLKTMVGFHWIQWLLIVHRTMVVYIFLKFLDLQPRVILNVCRITMLVIRLRFDYLENIVICVISLYWYSTSDHVLIDIFSASVHLPRIGHDTPGFNWYGTEKLIKKHLSAKGIPTNMYTLFYWCDVVLDIAVWTSSQKSSYQLSCALHWCSNTSM